MALPDDSSPHSPGGKGKQTAGQQMRCVPSFYFAFQPSYYFFILSVHITRLCTIVSPFVLSTTN